MPTKFSSVKVTGSARSFLRHFNLDQEANKRPAVHRLFLFVVFFFTCVADMTIIQNYKCNIFKRNWIKLFRFFNKEVNANKGLKKQVQSILNILCLNGPKCQTAADCCQTTGHKEATLYVFYDAAKAGATGSPGTPGTPGSPGRPSASRWCFDLSRSLMALNPSDHSGLSQTNINPAKWKQTKRDHKVACWLTAEC